MVAAPVSAITGAGGSITASTLKTRVFQAASVVAPAVAPVDRERALAMAAQDRAEDRRPISALSDMLSGDAEDGVAKALETSEKKFYATVSALHTLQAQGPSGADDETPAADGNAAFSRAYAEFGPDASGPDRCPALQSQAA